MPARLCAAATRGGTWASRSLQPRPVATQGPPPACWRPPPRGPAALVAAAPPPLPGTCGRPWPGRAPAR
eukprot:3917570-Lingulodinium_polyedra.AAC.1